MLNSVLKNLVDNTSACRIDFGKAYDKLSRYDVAHVRLPSALDLQQRYQKRIENKEHGPINGLIPRFPARGKRVTERNRPEDERQCADSDLLPFFDFGDFSQPRNAYRKYSGEDDQADKQNRCLLRIGHLKETSEGQVDGY